MAALAMQAYKIVNGERDFMGTLCCGRSAPALTCPMPQGLWHFTSRGDTLAGNLDLPDGRRFRDVLVTRATP